MTEDNDTATQERPSTYQQREENPPTVPLHGDRTLVWMEWVNLSRGVGVAHWHYHHAEPGTNETNTAMAAILTTEERASDLGSTPCPHCFPEHPENDHLIASYDEETGVATTIDPEEYLQMEEDLQNKDGNENHD